MQTPLRSRLSYVAGTNFVKVRLTVLLKLFLLLLCLLSLSAIKSFCPCASLLELGENTNP